MKKLRLLIATSIYLIFKGDCTKGKQNSNHGLINKERGLSLKVQKQTVKIATHKITYF